MSCLFVRSLFSTWLEQFPCYMSFSDMDSAANFVIVPVALGPQGMERTSLHLYIWADIYCQQQPGTPQGAQALYGQSCWVVAYVDPVAAAALATLPVFGLYQYPHAYAAIAAVVRLETMAILAASTYLNMQVDDGNTTGIQTRPKTEAAVPHYRPTSAAAVVAVITHRPAQASQAWRKHRAYCETKLGMPLEPEEGNSNKSCAVSVGMFGSRRDALHRHANEHTRDTAHICKACDQSSVKNSKFVEHCPNNTGKNRKCETCGELFHLAGHLSEHYRPRTDERPYRCEDTRARPVLLYECYRTGITLEPEGTVNFTVLFDCTVATGAQQCDAIKWTAESGHPDSYQKCQRALQIADRAL
ncbi:uncharacterized protein [Dermacentor andersoni]|uniref:uncharacterized protein isoform X2 n=1 Tax=Dermacentor andersoni TaxID=34620 RepID=UPI003B3A4932